MLKDLQKHNESITPNSAFLNELHRKLPEFFTPDEYDEQGNLLAKGAFDLAKFQDALRARNIDELSSGYQIDFIGKDYAKKQAGEKSTTVIVPDTEHNALPENRASNNLFLTGDNLEVLRHLQNNYNNAVDIVYIDPPYNTGSDGFVYPDTFEYSDQALQDMFGLNDQELSRLKSIQGKATHAAWLTFMYPRLWLAKRLLRDEGIIFIHIDENEHANLKLLCNELFGEANDLGEIIWDKRNPKGDATGISQQHEVILAYCKNSEAFKAVNSLKRPKENARRMIDKVEALVKKHQGVTDAVRKEYKEWIAQQNFSGGEKAYNQIDDNGDIFRPVSMAWPNKKKAPDDYFIPLNHPLTGKPCPLPERGWRNPSSTMRELQEKGLILFGKDESTQPNRKYLLKENMYENVPSLFYFGGSDDALLSSLDIHFDNPKPVSLVKRMLNSIQGIENGVILDFFAGSGTTAHAVMELNAENGFNHSFITVQLPEPVREDNPARALGFTAIDEMSRERLKRAACSLREQFPGSEADLGFQHYRFVTPVQQTLDDLDSFDIATGNFLTSSGQLTAFSESGFDNMITPFSAKGLGITGKTSGEETILTTWLVSDGYRLDVATEKRTFAGYAATYVDGTRLYLIEEKWRAGQTRELLNQIGTHQLTVQTVVIYGYSFDLESIRELEIGLKQLNQKVNLVKRY
jgi:adenine-specific DNA-methyltransferase